MRLARHPRGAPHSKGGQFAQAAHPDEQNTQKLSLAADCQPRQEGKSKITLGVDRKRAVLRKKDGIWVSNRPYEYEIVELAQQHRPFTEDDNEVLDHISRVTVDMLNAGDIDPDNRNHLAHVRAGVLLSGVKIQFEGAWRKAQLKFGRFRYQDQLDLVFLSAYHRCSQYLLRGIESGRIPCRNEGAWSQGIPYWVRVGYREDRRLAHGRWFLSSDSPWYYSGIDNRLLHRLLELDIYGQHFFDKDRQGNLNDMAAQWVAAFLMVSHPVEDQWHQRAKRYLQESDDLSRLRLDLKRILNPQAKTHEFSVYRYEISDYQWDRDKVKQALRELALIRHQNQHQTAFRACPVNQNSREPVTG